MSSSGKKGSDGRVEYVSPLRCFFLCVETTLFLWINHGVVDVSSGHEIGILVGDPVRFLDDFGL